MHDMKTFSEKLEGMKVTLIRSVAIGVLTVDEARRIMDAV